MPSCASLPSGTMIPPSTTKATPRPSIFSIPVGGGGLEEAESLFYEYYFTYRDLCRFRSGLDSDFQSYVINKALDLYYGDIDDLDEDDPDDAEALGEAFERCVQYIANRIPDHYGYTFAYELADFEWPDDIRDAVMARVFGEDWRNQ